MTYSYILNDYKKHQKSESGTMTHPEMKMVLIGLNCPTAPCLVVGKENYLNTED